MQTQPPVANSNLAGKRKGTRSQPPPHSNSLGRQFADDTLALRFSELHGADLRYTATWARWSCWTGTRWKRDETHHVYDLARAICRRASSSCTSEHLAHRVASAATIAAVERLARADRRHAMAASQWDSDPWILNTPVGIVDLRTGLLRPAARGDYCTKETAVGPNAGCPQWDAFLARVLGGDMELQRFVQRMCGCALTGVTRDHALFFAWGSGANGKSVFTSTLSGVMGDYARTAPIETFMASGTEHHPTDVAGLHGARLVTASETEDGRRWAESRLKTLTGGDKISARFMRQDYFDFVPQFKLIISGNHKPCIRTVDEAIRRRLYLLPFIVTIPPEERDPELAEKLRSEWAGILSWMIEGCLAWQREGLNPPPIVKNATVEYLEGEDALARWIEECCTLGSQFFTSQSDLFASWKQWCERNGEQAGSSKRLSQNLDAKGFERKRSTSERGFKGIFTVPV